VQCTQSAKTPGLPEDPKTLKPKARNTHYLRKITKRGKSKLEISKGWGVGGTSVRGEERRSTDRHT